MKRRLLILGVGNPLMGDDGVGIEAVRRLASTKLPHGVEAIDGGSSGAGLIDLISESAETCIIDAVDMGKSAGAVVEFKPEQVRSLASERPLSMHQTDLLGVLNLMTQLGDPPKVAIIAVQPENVGPGIGLSSKVERAIPELIRRVRHRPSFDGPNAAL